MVVCVFVAVHSDDHYSSYPGSGTEEHMAFPITPPVSADQQTLHQEDGEGEPATKKVYTPPPLAHPPPHPSPSHLRFLLPSVPSSPPLPSLLFPPPLPSLLL